MKILFQFKKVLIILSLSLFLFGLNSLWVNPTYADIRQQEEAPGQTLLQSRQSIRDRHDQTWQVVLFKRVKNGEVDQVDLRLVGYPDQTEFLHPKSLIISLENQADFAASDQFATEAPAPNVGQFDLKEILPQLPTNQSIQLILPLKDPLTLKIPVAVLLEWKLVI